jgi:hypothetical protein
MQKMPGSFYEEDEWHERDYHRGYGYVQPPRAPPRRSGDLLAPVADYGGSSLHRSRSQGHSPAPNIYVYNRTDVQERESSPARGRRDDRTGDIVNKLGDIDRDIRRLSRSRGPEYRAPSPYDQQYALQMANEERWRLQQADARIARMEEERRYQHDTVDRNRDEDLIRKKLELDRLRDKIREDQEENKWEDREKALKTRLKLKELEDDLKKQHEDSRKKDDKERILLEHDRQIAKAKGEREKLLAEIKIKEEEEEEERKRVIAEAQAKEAKKKRAQEDEEKAAVARYEQKKRDEKAKDEAARAKWKAEEEERKRKEKEEEDAWKLKLKMKEEKEKEKQKAKEKEVEEEMHKKLAVFGFQENQIEAVLNPKKAADLPAGYSPMHPRPSHSPRPAIGWTQTQTPTYIKVSRDHLDVETLIYYGLRYELDVVSSLPIICDLHLS